MPVTMLGDVHVIDLGDGDNRLTDDVLNEFHRLLDDLEAGAGARALVTRGRGSIWSNGLDIGYTTEHPALLWRYVADVERLLVRVIVLGVPTIAAITGHAFGAGAMLSLCHDVSVMRSDRGYWCLPEIDLGMGLRRFTADEALAAGIVDETAAEHHVVDRAVEIATDRAPTATSTLGDLKRGMYGAVADALQHDADEALAVHHRSSPA